MTAWPDAVAVRAFLARASRRLALLSAAQGAAAGLTIALLLAAVGWPAAGDLGRSVIVGLLCTAAGVVASALLARARRKPIALLVERRAPECKNIIITADELIAPFAGSARAGSALATSEYVKSEVYRQAARVVGSLDPATLFPGRNVFAALGVSAALWLLAIARIAAPDAVSRASAPAIITSAVIKGVDVSVVPPAYAHQPTVSSRDPARIEALVGSRVRLTVHADAGSVVIETVRGRATLSSSARGTFSGEVQADADGFIAVEPATSAGRTGVRRLIGLTVIPDHPPRVRIVKPGQDLFFHDAHQAIDLSIDATDDIGLASLRLRYTKVSGSGERFTFVEGEVPIAVSRTSTRAWTAHAHWNLDALSLTPGDMVVYRAVAADERPGATPVESDSFIAELLAPGGDAAAGFALDPDEERYAVSEQMVILKTQRLMAKRASMSADALSDSAQDIGGEQRKVRAEFVFMMGGELADAPAATGNLNDLNETAEAEGESDLAAGRMANQGRIALVGAIRSMSRASTWLTTAGLDSALVQERAALAQLERAFSRSRILLRALTQREALDLTRRLTGVLTDAARDVHPSADPQRDPRVVALRQALASIATLAATPRLDTASARITDLAQRVLQVDPSAKALQEVVTLLAGAATASAAGHATDARAQLDRAATALATSLRADLLLAPSQTSSVDASRLKGALSDELRAARVRP